jgi:excisionase family DNA binding protein
MNNDIKQYGDKNDVAAMLQLSKRTVDTLLSKGMPHLRIGARRVRFDMDEVQKWLKEKFYSTEKGKRCGGGLAKQKI